MRLNRSWVAFAGVGCAAVAGAFVAGRLWAAGIPSGDGALTYSGTLEDANGAPATGEHPIDIRFYSSASTGTTPVCQTPAPANVKLVAGRFSIPLPDACTTAVHANPNLWVQVLVDGTALGSPTKLGAVPYAVEADHAKNTDTAASAIAAGGALDDRIKALETRLGNLSRPQLFSWSDVIVSGSGVETFPSEDTQTITFQQAGYYRITLDAQAIHDTNDTGAVNWYIGGTATRRDPYSQESGSRIYIPMDVGSSNSRLVESTVLFVSATTGQTLTLRPSLTVTYAGGIYHSAQFLYAVEYIGS